MASKGLETDVSNQPTNTHTAAFQNKTLVKPTAPTADMGGVSELRCCNIQLLSVRRQNIFSNFSFSSLNIFKSGN